LGNERRRRRVTTKQHQQLTSVGRHIEYIISVLLSTRTVLLLVLHLKSIIIMSSIKQQSDAEEAIAARSDNRSNSLRNHDEEFAELIKKRDEDDMAIWKQSRDRLVALEMENADLKEGDKKLNEYHEEIDALNILTEQNQTLKRSQVNATEEIKTAKDLLRAGGALLADYDDDVVVPGLCPRTRGQEALHNALRDNAVLEERVNNYENAINLAIEHLNKAFTIVLDE
jgi:hypothetical protein